ncbi:hypothetical protein Syun_005242 [Stephania yunnanensis]|uniref:TF-B3 domain-containing protein n=1 Tax=Stephania yunnanensis TaxID=152371 RepID=A0AAP0L709_9MAGN
MSRTFSDSMVHNHMASTPWGFSRIMIDEYKYKMPLPSGLERRLRGLRENATLRSEKEGSWSVKVKRVKGRFFLETGWRSFVKEHELLHGDFLFFHYEGNMVFNVIVYSPSGGVKAYHSTPLTTSETKQNDNENAIVSFDGQASPCAIVTPSDSRPYFVKEITTEILTKKHCMNIPMSFTETNGLNFNGWTAVLRDQRKKTYMVKTKFTKLPFTRVKFTKGLMECLMANEVKVGDVCVMELDVASNGREKFTFDVIFKDGSDRGKALATD